jgi:hypothetical protein
MMHDEVSSRSAMERGPALRVPVEVKQDVSRGTLPSAMASITRVREPEGGTSPLGKDIIAGNCVLCSSIYLFIHLFLSEQLFYRANARPSVPSTLRESSILKLARYIKN